MSGRDSDKDARGALKELSAFHRRVDREARSTAAQNAGRLQCGAGCADCCKDNLSVHPVEADSIRHHHEVLLRDGSPHPIGACAFLDERRRCRIYEQRPYICRTQGLPMRWFDTGNQSEGAEDEIVELRDICPLNLPGPALEAIPPTSCWLLGPQEQELAEIARSHSNSAERIPLRSLFRTGGR